MANLTCEQCNYVNEAERVYCHNCGAKLDRSVLPKSEEEKGKESPEVARKRITKMTNPRAGGLMRELKALLKTLALGAVAASLLLIARVPEGTPESKRELAERMVSAELMDAAAVPQPVALAFTEGEVNSSLRQSVKFKEAMLPGVEFKRLYVQFHPGAVHAGLEQSVWGLPLHSGVDYQVPVVAGKITPVIVGGNFGRLRVHPLAMQYLDFAFKKVWGVMKRDREHLEKMQSITLSEGRVVLVTKGAVR